VRRRGLLTAVVSVLISGCTVTFGGTAAVDPAQLTTSMPYVPSSFEITYATDSPADQIARDALEDVIAYYSSFYPEVYGGTFEPPRAYYSIGPGEGHKSDCMTSVNDDTIVDNAFYCSSSTADEVAYWRPLLERYAGISRLQVGLVLAHELGHTIQARERISGVRTIVKETQADCFAGTWARAVADGAAPHFTFSAGELDATLIVWATEFPGEVGSDPNNRTQHGSAFDRVTAFQEGYESGPTACRDNFTERRTFTAMRFTADNIGDDGQGNAAYEATVDLAQTLFDAFYDAEVPQFQGDWTEPPVVVQESRNESCAATDMLMYCPATASVLATSDADLRAVHRQYGDFALITALGLAYGQAALVELGKDPRTDEGIRAASCLTGAAAGELIDPANRYKITLSPGDFDEATVLLLSVGADTQIVAPGGLTAFQRVDAFRSGVTNGVAGCAL
jgi:predicted metalloprotease